MKNDRGVVLVTVLWTTILLTALAAALVSGVRLSALTAYYYQKSAERLSARISAVAIAKMELMLVRMPRPAGVSESEKKRRTRNGYVKKEAYMFNGQALSPHYPLPEGVTLHIFDHAGLIDLRRLTVANMRKLLAKLLPEKSDDQLNNLVNCWQDWIDADDLKRLGGAEKEYYQSLDPPYLPRNSALETVDELLLIKGFAELFKDIDIHAVFTMHGNGNDSRINFNLAPPEALAMVPGLDEKDVENILKIREEREIKSAADLKGIIDPDHLNSAKAWISLTTSNYYTIFVTFDPPRPNPAEPMKNSETGQEESVRRISQWGYAEQVRARGYHRPPQTLRVDPLLEMPVMVGDQSSGNERSTENVDGIF